ncbi:MAG TPA: pilus assembly protein PilM [Lacipirellulaceae bacterium]|jgi:type IV pilus assembly protein PilM
MARSDAVWGIDLGQCALKALRCRAHEKDDNRIVVEAFDYIEYPKILTQPEANRDELIRDALEQFHSRNQVAGDRVAISVPGQSGLARFIKLPPVESKKIPDIVKYEARQQIPFALDDVIWDYQPLAGGSVDEGYALETEVGIFAMKRDQVAKALKPFEDAGVEVDLIQLAPLSIYNFICFDQLSNLQTYDRANPPPSKVVLSLGTDTTDLVITDGFRVWQRSIPIGGNHFTKALTKELKLTFAKAEHLKRNAMKAENPKLVFQAMRPVFSDLVAEIQRSIGFFTSNNRTAKLGSVVALGNPMKLPGLQRFLSQNLDQEVAPLEQFNALVGGSVIAVPQFKDNQLTFGVAYGLCVQELGKSQLHTNLLPMEIITKRLVRAKKPWAVAAAALLLSGMAVNYFSYYSAWRSAAVDKSFSPAMANALKASKDQVTQSANLAKEQSDLAAKFDDITKIGQNLQSNVDGRLLWLELLKAIDTAMPKDARPADQRKETAEDVTARNELHIQSMDCEFLEDVGPWFAAISPLYAESKKASAGASAPSKDAAAAGQPPAADAAAAPASPNPAPPAEAQAAATPPAAAAAAPAGDAAAVPASLTGPGWVIEVKGYHFHNSDTSNEGREFIEHTLFHELEEGTVQLPDGEGGKLIDVPIKDLGISYPVVITQPRIRTVDFDPDASDADAPGQAGRMAMSRDDRGPRMRGEAAADQPEHKIWKLRKYDFVIQFCWQPKTRTQRREKPAVAGDSAAGTAAANGPAAPAG